MHQLRTFTVLIKANYLSFTLFIYLLLLHLVLYDKMKNYFVVIFFVGAFGRNRASEEVSLFPSLPVTVSKSDNLVCKDQGDLYRDNLENFTLWAYEMWDSTAKSSAGVLRGNVFQFGHYKQCLTAKAPFPTQYCLATLVANVPKPKKSRDNLSLYYNPLSSVFQRFYKTRDLTQQTRNVIKAGWCVPSSCTQGDLATYLNEYLEKIEHPLIDQNVTYSAEISKDFCVSQVDDQFYTSADIIFCLLTTVLIVLAIVVTVYDCSVVEEFKEKSKESTFYKYIMAFSAKRNFADLNRIEEKNPALKILYGFRTVSIFVIIISHRFGTIVSSAVYNFDHIEQTYRQPWASFLFHGDLFVDSFFFLGGLLGMYTLSGYFEKKTVTPGLIILNRYVRLTPAYAFVIFYYATMFNYTGEGPLWKVIAGGDSRDCKDNWWTNLLYISNYVNADHMCMTHSWYLPCDFHYFIIAVGVALLFRKQRKLGISALLFLAILSISIPFILTVAYHRPAMLFFYPDFLTGPKSHPDFLLTYIKSHTRATAHIIGMAAGYFYYRVKDNNNLHICRIRSTVITIISAILLLSAMFGCSVFYNPYHEYNIIESGLYAAFNRAAWGVGTFGILYVTSYGHLKALYNFFTWSPWIPLSKLVYCAYLAHMQFQLRWAGKVMTPTNVIFFDVLSLGASDLMLAFLTALVLYLIVEAPFRIIFRHMLSPSRKAKPKSEVDSRENNNEDSRL